MHGESYVLRVYRCSKKGSGETVVDGIVELPATGRRIAFHSMRDLWGILAAHTKPLRTKDKRAVE